MEKWKPCQIFEGKIKLSSFPLKEHDADPDDFQRRTNDVIEVHEIREKLYNKSQLFKEKIKHIDDKKFKENDFRIQDLVMNSDSKFEEKGKHGNFDHLWKGPYIITDF